MTDWIKNWLLVGFVLYWFCVAVVRKPETQAWPWSLFFVVLWPFAVAYGVLKGIQEGWKRGKRK